MRAFALTIVVMATTMSAASAPAQTYAPDYPVCLEVYGRGAYNECYYTSLAQCRLSAAGRSATCVRNPFFAATSPAQGRRPKHHEH